MGDEFDAIIGTVSPSVPVKLPASVTVPTEAGGDLAMGGAFAGASRFDSQMAFWAPTLRSADADMIPDKPLADARARDMVQNDGYIQGGATLHKDNIVGAQFALNAKPASRPLFGKQDDVWEGEFQEEVEELFDLAAESPDHLFDASRMNTFTGMVRLATGIYFAAGEVLGTVEWIKDGRPFNTAIQMVDLDRLSTPPMQRYDNSWRAGVQRDARSAPITYGIQKMHPADYRPNFLQWQDANSWAIVPVRKPWGRVQVIHVLEQQRVDQTRGLADITAALKEIYMTRRWRDVNLQNAIVQALYAAAITSDLPSEAVFAQLGSGTINADTWAKAVADCGTGMMTAISQYAGKANGLQIDGVRIPHLFPGTKLDIMAPRKGGPLGSEAEQSLLRYIAAATGVSYEQLSRDFTQTNYSGFKGALSETWKFMGARKKAVADRFATIIYRLWLEEMVNKGGLRTFPKEKAGLLYTSGVLNLGFEALSRCDWIGASRGQVDELKETQAAILRVNNGLSTLEDEIARLGGDWRKKLRQMAREQKLKDELGILQQPTDTTNQMNAASGSKTGNPKPKGSGGKGATGETAPSTGTAENLFLDSEHNDGE